MSNKYALNNHPANLSAVARALFLIALTVSLALLVTGSAVEVNGQRTATTRVAPNRLAPQGGKDAASIVFQGGRDLISDQEWAKAEDKFREYTSNFPKEKNIDAALYWMAYSEFQLSRYEQAKSTLKRLLDDYETSSWKGDARTLLAQIPDGFKVVYGPGSGSGSGPGLGLGSGIGRAYVIGNGTPQARPEVWVTPETAPYAVVVPRSPAWSFDMDDPEHPAGDDDPCEFKIVVLQALFQSDVQRGITAATEWLNQGSGQTTRCKGAALTLLARNGGKAVTPVILGVAQREPDLKLRSRAISALGFTGDDTVIEPLRDFVLNSQESSIVEAALYSLAQHSGPRAIVVLGEIAMSNKPVSVRKVAISSIASRPGEPSVDALLKIYDADQTVEIRRVTIAGFGHRRSERAGAKLLEIARGADNIELRKAAISGMVSRSGEKSLDSLLSLYDGEKSEELKDRIINAVGSMNDTRVTKKLIEIAKNPQSPIERRKRAIGWLSRSKDPEVTKFLEDLLK
ncbi:MAG: HEAT repeat domain-containing protein [Acidobacteriota bacterium]|nr:HEAT repeat domain-containing protein [Acidobacteriota bacterium]